jgi:hypothetical protein
MSGRKLLLQNGKSEFPGEVMQSVTLILFAQGVLLEYIG